MNPTGSVEMSVRAARSAERGGAWDDALDNYHAALSEIRSRADRRGEAHLLRTMGRVYMERGLYDNARAHFAECLVVAQACGETALAASALNAMAAVAQLRGQIEVAESLYKRAVALALEVGDKRLCAVVDQNLGTLANIRGDLPGALQRYHASLGRFREIGDDRSAAMVLNNIGMLQVDVNEWGPAELSFTAAYTISARLADLANMGRIDLNRAEMFIKKQNYERARDFCDRAFDTFTRIASDAGLANVHKFYGVVYRETGQPEVAHMQFGLSLQLARGCHAKLTEAEIESDRARVFLNQRNYRPALQSLKRANELFAELDASREIMDVARRRRSLEEPYMAAFQQWAAEESVLEGERTVARGVRVGEIAMRLLRVIGQDALIPDVRLGAFLHDVGMSAVPQELVSRQGPLTSEERETVERHTLAGEDIVRELQFPESVLPIVRHHHERWDGTGYPDRLCSDEIPLAARVVCIADVFDALTSDRSYRAALSDEEALAIMAQDAGGMFDPHLFARFTSIFGSHTVGIAPDATVSRA